MKTLTVLVALAVLLTSLVSATTTTLVPDAISMDFTDSETTQFCLFEEGLPQDVQVVVNPICKDQDGLIGCSAGDLSNPSGFSVVPVDSSTGADGCTDVVITTSLGSGQEGRFYFTVNGQVAQATVGSETGHVDVIPEFGVLASGLILAVAGIFIMRKRK